MPPQIPGSGTSYHEVEAKGLREFGNWKTLKAHSLNLRETMVNKVPRCFPSS